MAICIGKNKGWGPAKRALQAQGITVHFQDKEGVVNYVGAYIYVCDTTQVNPEEMSNDQLH